jgi:hypothetical protein
MNLQKNIAFCRKIRAFCRKIRPQYSSSDASAFWIQFDFIKDESEESGYLTRCHAAGGLLALCSIFHAFTSGLSRACPLATCLGPFAGLLVGVLDLRVHIAAAVSWARSGAGFGPGLPGVDRWQRRNAWALVRSQLGLHRVTDRQRCAAALASVTPGRARIVYRISVPTSGLRPVTQEPVAIRVGADCEPEPGRRTAGPGVQTM